jgi:molybdopterin/thiamine biosynthesis adenylyltransferase
MDVAVDALDNISSRLLLNKTAQSLGIPMVHGAIAGFTGQVTTLLPGDHGLEKIYKITAGSDKGIENMLGNPAATPALAAAIQAQEVIKLLTGIVEVYNTSGCYISILNINLFEVFFPELTAGHCCKRGTYHLKTERK